MAGLIGKIDEFDSKCEEWKQYEQRLEHYFCSNGVTDEEKKRSALISVIGRDNFKLSAASFTRWSLKTRATTS